MSAVTVAFACTAFAPTRMAVQQPLLAARVARPPAMVDFGTAAQWLADAADPAILLTPDTTAAVDAAADAAAQPGWFDLCAQRPFSWTCTHYLNLFFTTVL